MHLDLEDATSEGCSTASKWLSDIYVGELSILGGTSRDEKQQTYENPQDSTSFDTLIVED